MSPEATVAIALFVLNAVALVAIRYEALRKDSRQTQRDIGGIGAIARDAKRENLQLELMAIYLGFLTATTDEARAGVMRMLWEAATKRR